MNDTDAPDTGPAALLERHSDRLLARVRTMLGDSARRVCDSLDYVQEAWVDLLRSPEGRDAGGEEDLVRRFCAIARNNVRDACRRKREIGFESIGDSRFDAHAVAVDETSAGSRIGRAEFVASLRRAAGQLSPELRHVIEMRALDGMSFVDIARALGRKEDTVRKAYNRALLELSRKL